MTKPTTTTVEKKKLAENRSLSNAGTAAVVGESVSFSQVTAATSSKPRESSYAGLVRRLAKDYGVKVASIPAATTINPYRASSDVTKEALQGAGVLTRSGKLARHLK